MPFATPSPQSRRLATHLSHLAYSSGAITHSGSPIKLWHHSVHSARMSSVLSRNSPPACQWSYDMSSDERHSRTAGCAVFDWISPVRAFVPPCTLACQCLVQVLLLPEVAMTCRLVEAEESAIEVRLGSRACAAVLKPC